MFSLIIGGITHHYLGSSLPYCNRVNNFGTITNPYVVAMKGNEKVKAGFILGTDSACGVISGPISSFKLTNNFDFIAGAYNTNYKQFNDLEIKPVTFGGITPVLGVNYKIQLMNNIALNNIISVGIVSHALSISF